MLTLLLPGELADRLVQSLVRAREREIGGVMMAEHTGPNEFILRDMTIQRRGSCAAFVRRVAEARSGLCKFFEHTNGDYTRQNYIGEWHSHPCFETEPSPRDHQSMREIIQDESVGVNFAVLMIVKLSATNTLLGSIHTYLPNGGVLQSTLVLPGSGSEI